jgi:uncharacterized protein
MITDCCAHVGAWPHRNIGVGAAELARMLGSFEVSQIFAGRLEALWLENPQDANRLPAEKNDAVTIVPVLDPTVATWSEELARLVRTGALRIVRLYPNYGSYTLEQADPLLAALAKRGIVAQIHVRMEDLRRQHPRAVVPDVPVKAVADAAERHPELKVLLSGASTPELRTLADRASKLRNLWADSSQADGCGAVGALLKTPWRERLLFGSHVPLFIPYSAVARVVLDVDDDAAEIVMSINPKRLLG